MKPPTFDPPYGSKIEYLFAELLVKHLRDEVDFSAQKECVTLCGKFILDFLATTPEGNKIAFECDGKEYHDPHRDEWRDAMIIGSGYADEIYRIRGSDINYHLYEILYAISIFSPNIFTERAKYILSKEANEYVVKNPPGLHETSYQASFYREDERELSQLYIERRHIYIPEGQRQFWQSAYSHALNVGGGKLDDVMRSFCPST